MQSSFDVLDHGCHSGLALQTAAARLKQSTWWTPLCTLQVRAMSAWQLLLNRPDCGHFSKLLLPLLLHASSLHALQRSKNWLLLLTWIACMQKC
jgi:hypothetical protein